MKFFSLIRSLTFAAALALAAPAAAQTSARAYDGDWEGVLHAGAQNLRLELHLKTEGDQTTGQLSSLDQGISMPTTGVKVEEGELGILFLAAGGELRGKLSPDGKTVVGSWTQGTSLPLTLTRKTAK